MFLDNDKSCLTKRNILILPLIWLKLVYLNGDLQKRTLKCLELVARFVTATQIISLYAAKC